MEVHSGPPLACFGLLPANGRAFEQALGKLVQLHEEAEYRSGESLKKGLNFLRHSPLFFGALDCFQLIDKPRKIKRRLINGYDGFFWGRDFAVIT